MTKVFRQTIMKWSQLTTIYFKTNTAESLRSYMKQEYFCSKLYKKEWKEYYHILKLNKVTDNKRFAKTIKPFLSDTGTYINKFALTDSEKVMSGDKQVSGTCVNFFF